MCTVCKARYIHAYVIYFMGLRTTQGGWDRQYLHLKNNIVNYRYH